MTAIIRAIFSYCLFATTLLFGQRTGEVVTPHVAPTIKFTENLGQWDNRVLVRATLPGGALFLEKNCVTYNFYDKAKLGSLHLGGIIKGEQKDFSLPCHAYKVHFLNSRQQPALEKMQMANDYENFYMGNDQNKWKSNVRNYAQIWLRGLYEGIDYEILSATDAAKYNFHIQPGADPLQIRMLFEGAEELKLRDGALHVRTSVNQVMEQRPYAYQLINGAAVEVPCKYKLQDNVLSFVFPKGYDRSAALVIDPVLVFAAQIGSVADNFGMTATFDKNGNLYSGGVVYAAGYPYVTGSYTNTFLGPSDYGGADVFVTKYNASGNALLFSTYLGGTSTEVCSSMIVDSNDNLCIYGATGSSDFPVTGGAADNTFNGGTPIGFINNGMVFKAGTDIYITKFNAAGSALIGSTFFGGSGNDGINYLASTYLFTYNNTPTTIYQIPTCDYDSLIMNYGDQFRGEIQVDDQDNIYICSSTRSGNLPVVSGFDITLGGPQDAVVAKFNPNLSTLLYSTYLGGSHVDCGNSIYVTPDKLIYATGGTCSSDFPNTTGAHSANYNGGKSDGFITRINANGTHHLSTYVGTSNYDNSFFVQCDKYGEVYIFGQSLGNMPVQAVTTLSVYSVPNTHQFVCTYNGGLTARLMSTVFGSKTNGLDISPSAFAIDECNGNIYLSGWGGGIITNTGPLGNMPIVNPTQASTTGYDFYLMALKPHATALLYGSYYGGGTSQEHVDGGTSRFDRKGTIYQSVCAGCGGNDDFPITPNAWPCPATTSCPNRNFSSNCNNGVIKINFDLQKAISSISTSTNAGCAPLTVTLVNTVPGTGYEWNLGNGITTSVIPNPVVTFSTPGTHTVTLFVRDTTMCITEDSTFVVFTVHPGTIPGIALSTTPCTNFVSLSAELPPGSGNPQWNLGNSVTSTNTALTFTYNASGIYTITLSTTNSYSCTGVKTTTVSVLNFQPVGPESNSLCTGASVQLHAQGGSSYNWSPPVFLDNAQSADPVSTPTVSTLYTVTVTNNSYGQNCSSQFTAEVDVKPTPVAAFEYTLHPCGGSAAFADQSFADVTKWNWQFGAQGSSTLASPRFFFEESGTHTVVLTVSNLHGCSNRLEKILQVGAADVAVNGAVNICVGGTVELFAAGGYEYKWLPETHVEHPYLPKTKASPSVTTEYSVIITTGQTNSVTSSNCEFTLTTMVTVSELSPVLPVSAAASPSVVIAGKTTTLNYTGDEGAQITWLPLRSTSPEEGYTVVAAPLKPTTYTVVARRDACVERILVDVLVYSDKCLSEEIFIPNTFTPNGDGANDLFRVRGLSVDEVYFAVFNRWGEKVFETSDKTGGWDGKYQNKDADVGVFGWYLKVKCFNGEETFLKGNVTLIR